MGYIMDKTLEQFNLVEVPCKPVKALRIVRIAYEKTILVELEPTVHGRQQFCVAREIDTKRWCFPLSYKAWSWQSGLVQAMAKLGLISKKDVKRLKENDKKREQKRNDLNQAEKLKVALINFDIELTEEQRKHVPCTECGIEGGEHATRCTIGMAL